MTQGATLLTAATLVRKAWPDATVQGFALLRTLRPGVEVERVVDPVVGRIVLTRWGDTYRQP